jgi:hypothetical protein
MPPISNPMPSTRAELFPGGSASGYFSGNGQTDASGHAHLIIFPADNLSVTAQWNGFPPIIERLGSVTQDTAVTIPKSTTPQDTTAPVITPHVGGTQGAAGWYTTDVTVTWDVGDAESGIASADGCDATTISTDTVGTTLTCSATNRAGLRSSRSVTVKRDATPPELTPVVQPAAPDGQNGWYRTDVAVSWNLSDGLSGLASSSGCNGGAVTADTRGTTFTCSATDAAGNHRDNEITIKRDGSAPSIAQTVAPSAPDGANGWYVSSPLVTFACSDDISGVAACVADGESGATRRVGEAADVQRISGTATDAAGNVNHSSTELRVDLSDPVVSCAGTPTFLLHQAGAQVSAAVADSASGAVATSLTNSVTTAPVGTFTTSFTGRDRAGRSTTASCAYNVVYDWAGFFAPVTNTGRNMLQAGAAIPFKFSLKGNQGLAVVTAGYPQSQPISCDNGAPLGPPTEATAAGASALSYDASTDTYSWVWKTETAWAATCRMFVLKLDDGTSHTAVFTFG